MAKIIKSAWVRLKKLASKNKGKGQQEDAKIDVPPAINAQAVSIPDALERVKDIYRNRHVSERRTIDFLQTLYDNDRYAAFFMNDYIRDAAEDALDILRGILDKDEYGKHSTFTLLRRIFNESEFATEWLFGDDHPAAKRFQLEKKYEAKLDKLEKDIHFFMGRSTILTSKFAECLSYLEDANEPLENLERHYYASAQMSWKLIQSEFEELREQRKAIRSLKPPVGKPIVSAGMAIQDEVEEGDDEEGDGEEGDDEEDEAH